MNGLCLAFGGGMRAVLALILATSTLVMDPMTAKAGGMDSAPDIEPQAGEKSPAAAVPAPAKPWDKYQTALALNLGFFSAVGGYGLTFSLLPASFLETEAGVGVGGSGLQLSAMQKVVLGSEKTGRFVAGVGLSFAGGSSDAPDKTLWLNIDLAGVEVRTSHGVCFFVAGGVFTALTGGRFRFPGGSDCGEPYCSDAKGAIIPQGRAGIGFWL